MDEVYPNVWLGQYEAALDAQTTTLRRHKITHIVSIGLFEKWWTTRKDPKHLLLEMEDSPFVFVTDYFGQVFPFMDEALSNGGGVLVHCQQGQSRSSAIVIAYLMRKLQKQYPETLNKILIHRKKGDAKYWFPNPNHFVTQSNSISITEKSQPTKKIIDTIHTMTKKLRHFGKNRWNSSIQYSDKIDIEKELANALKNLSLQVTKLQSDINKKEKLYVTISVSSDKEEEEKQYPTVGSTPVGQKKTKSDPSDEHWKRHVVIGLDENDLAIFRKEWVLLVFLCHQFQLYEIAVHRNTSNILFILGEMYFSDLLHTFQEVFEPKNKDLILDYDNPSASIAAALQIYAQKEREKAKTS
ncbi:hypothetical protein RFI_27318 [Reticulomyxa filosa]|uniref:Protein-tyrosine-phosphatase n=1 Tax=Reticulomyxa filosa TaxID=46433 RepID=X6M7V0_RETFI|nr:hypothetical protein RFI_27318 [Reticulomyxa filosa]|eukprot:ETO10058.1 hypothetical protein RFI_27318 [Reticulomyxa filosa]